MVRTLPQVPPAKYEGRSLSCANTMSRASRPIPTTVGDDCIERRFLDGIAVSRQPEAEQFWVRHAIVEPISLRINVRNPNRIVEQLEFVGRQQSPKRH